MANDSQSRIWNTTAADAWIRYVDDFDATLNPFGRAVMDKLNLSPGDRVLDVGCGVGTATMDIARLVDQGSVTGVDISERMVAEATRRATERGLSNCEFVVADAQTADFGGEPFDVVFSRVGVMFFEDPQAAFANLASALVDGGRLGFVCFQSPMLNPFLSLPILAALEVMELPPPAPTGPGPFSLADPSVTTSLLEGAGLVDVRVESGPDEALIPASGPLEDVAQRLLEQNPYTSSRIREVSPDVAARTVSAVADVIAPHLSGDQIRMGAATWVATATKATKR